MATNYPKLRDDLVIKRMVMAGEVIHVIKNRETHQFYCFDELDWAIASQLNGENSYEQIAEHFNRQFPDTSLDAGQAEDYVDSLKKRELLERTPAERSIVILEKLQAERKKRAEQSQAQDIFYLTLATVNPEKFYKAIFPYLRWIWTRGFVAATLLLFTAAATVIIANWPIVREGMLKFWRLQEKTSADVVMFFCILAVIVTIHESAHALTCMNFGGEVNELGFMLIYFMPAFYAEVSDAYLFEKKWHKYWVTLAGGYSELIICSFAVFTWWLSQADSFIHHFAYNVMVFAGISTIIINYNPLIKLDGYYLLSDALEINNLRALSASYLGYLIKTRIFRLDAPSPSGLTPRKKRIFLIYGIFSTMYIIFIVSVFIIFQYRFFTRTFPDMGIFLGIAGGYLILRKRMRKLMDFSRFAFLDKRELLRQSASARRWAYVTGALLLLFFFYPFSHSVTGPVVLEPAHQLPLRAEIGGFVADVAADSDAPIPAGTLVVRLRNNELAARREKAQAELEELNGEAARALAAGDMAAYQSSLREQKRAEKELAEMRRQESKLEIRAPFAGWILTPRLQDLVGKHVAAGELLGDFGDLRTMRARIQISEFDFRELAEGQKARMQVSAFPGEIFAARVAQRSMAAPDAYDAAGRTTNLVRSVQAAGAKGEGTPFAHFELLVEVENSDGRLRPGMSGQAKITPDRHCVVARIFRFVWEQARSKVWW